MVGPSSSHAHNSTPKFLCSYGGKILPRYPDGKLRYLGGHTRVLALPRSTPFSEVMVKMGELCGAHVTHLHCQLPTEDLDALVSITSDEDLANLVEEYDRVSSLKIRAFLSPSASPTLSKTSSSSSCFSSSSSTSSRLSFCCATVTAPQPVMVRQVSLATAVKKSHVSPRCYGYPRVQGNRGVVYLVPNGNHWPWRCCRLSLKQLDD
ncbi:clustered mitochondria protein [Spatholobus suberectus]|nr:clustered mitochondria protein [Spatholobus suberectus]